jgi:hypothetical protein
MDAPLRCFHRMVGWVCQWDGGVGGVREGLPRLSGLPKGRGGGKSRGGECYGNVAPLILYFLRPWRL